MNTYTKIGADGGDLLPDVPHGEHTAVRISHPLLIAPLIVTAYKAQKEMNWKQAKKWAEGLEINGWSWRLPTAEEAMFIPDRSKYPAVDKTFFPDFENYEWIWTSTPDAESPSVFAWFVGLLNGHVNRTIQAGRCSVRAVRAGQ